ncbi:MAG TPA: hypothetical protein VHA13_03240, partial [Gammaproteobacteria bacterium]|nr:hypothetical protein [Gammaproteobacteria bacterium]
HTQQHQFTHFAGSEAGVETSFGIPCEKFATLVTNVINEFKQEEKQSSDLMVELADMVKKIKLLAERLRNNEAYITLNDIAVGMHDTGHIPLILSGGAAASQYNRATRSLSTFDLEIYFENIGIAKPQAREYLVKQDMMSLIAAFRETVKNKRYNLSKDNIKSNEFYLCNRVLKVIDEKIIKLNQASMPREYETFDLYHHFAQKVRDLICQIDIKLVGEAFIENLLNKLNRGNSKETPFDAQKKLSDDLYEVLHTYLTKLLKLDEEGDMTLSSQEDEALQNVLPLLAYLNSPQNPFARNGLLGKEISNSFHSAALDAYRKHESQQSAGNYTYHYQHKKGPAVIFNEDQIEALIYGAPEKQQTNSVVSFFRSLVTENSTSANSRYLTQSEERRQLLQLPPPPELLLLMPPEEQNKDQTIKLSKEDRITPCLGRGFLRCFFYSLRV